jgi:tRNA G18 (ribose-2'-O)-methylase SpoU
VSVPIRIEDIGDRRLDDYRGLRDPARRSRVEPAGGFFVAEGVLVIERLLASGIAVRSVALTEAKYRRLEPLLVDLPVPIYLVDREQMMMVVGFDLHRGALAAADRPPEIDLAGLEGAHAVCVLEGLNDHENLGAILRSAAALGIEGVVLDPTCADPWYRRSVRVSMGAVFELAIVRAEEWPDALDELRSLGFRIVALTVNEAAIPIDEVEQRLGTAVLLGAEGPGLSSGAVARSDLEATIPMVASFDSLNVGHAAAIAFHRFGDVTPRSRR